MKDNLMLYVYWLVIPAYFLTAVAFKISAFVSMMIAVMRTINIVDPFRRIRPKPHGDINGEINHFCEKLHEIPSCVLLKLHSFYQTQHISP